MRKIILAIAICLGLFGCQSDTENLRDGDIIFQTSTSSQSRAIQAATHSKYSHMGIIYKKDGEYFVFEAIQPVKLMPLDDWIKRGKGGHYVVKRLIDSDKLLTPDALAKMKFEGTKYLGKNYDLYFEWSDECIYCSELVWKIYKNALGIEIGKLQKFSEFDLSHPIVKAKLRERFGDKIPQNELVISPDQMFKSSWMEIVVKK